MPSNSLEVRPVSGAVGAVSPHLGTLRSTAKLNDLDQKLTSVPSRIIPSIAC